jgi:hypothetical protein
VTLMAARFADGTPKVLEANAKIKEVNSLLKQNLTDLDGIAKKISAIGSLVSIIDDLFKLPFSFV